MLLGSCMFLFICSQLSLGPLEISAFFVFSICSGRILKQFANTLVGKVQIDIMHFGKNTHLQIYGLNVSSQHVILPSVE